MNAGLTSERVYQALRRTILDHDLRPGDHLDPVPLADRLASSVTPVRDALNRLTGEGLVNSRPGDGYHLPAIDEPGLKDLLDWSAQVLLLALRSWPAAAPPIEIGDLPFDMVERAHAVGALFVAIAAGSANVEHRGMTAALQARLNPMRVVAARLTPRLPDDEAMIAAAATDADRAALRTAIAGYHRARRRHAAELVRLLYRAS